MAVGAGPETADTELPTSTPDRSPGFTVERGVEVPMRDGVRLSANVFRPSPAPPGPGPAILIRQPYGKDEHPTMWARGKYWARKGYACAIQDVRGKFASEGRWQPVVHEAADGWDTLDWVAAQPWCDGNIGMAGESYHGITQWAVAALGHPNLRCIAPGNATPDPYSMTYRGGAFVLPMALWTSVMEGRGIADPSGFDPWHLPLATMDTAMGLPSTAFQDLLAHPTRDAFWARADARRAPAAVRIPVFHWGGWYDVLLHGTLAGWYGAAAGRPAEPRCGDQWLVIGPTDHTLTPAAYGRGAAAEGSAGAWSFDRLQRFFDHYLRGEDDAFRESPRVSVYVMGAERWRDADTWPLPEARPRVYYLHGAGAANTAAGDGSLSSRVPGGEPVDRFAYDPRDPVDTWLGESLWDLSWALRDRSEVERRGDVLVYTSEPLAGELEVTGPLTMTLYASSSAASTDFCAALVDVFPDGSAHLVQEGIVRAGAGDGRGPALPLAPGAVAEYRIDLAATSYLFGPGHRLRLEVSSSIFGRYDRNLNTGRPAAHDVGGEVARQQVHHSRVYPSQITLPIVPAEAAPDAGPVGASRRATDRRH
ncbi:MAG: CocE/NonD family hydrolase [Thermoleophilia bacterium]